MRGQKKERLTQEQRTQLRPSAVCCPACGEKPPRRSRNIKWAERFGHRCTHGEPCAGFEVDRVLAHLQCEQCVQQRKQAS